MSAGWSVSRFARYIGLTEGAVRAGIHRGRLQFSVRRAGRRGWVIIDPALAAREWNNTRDPAKVTRGRDR